MAPPSPLEFLRKFISRRQASLSLPIIHLGVAGLCPVMMVGFIILTELIQALYTQEGKKKIYKLSMEHFVIVMPSVPTWRKFNWLRWADLLIIDDFRDLKVLIIAQDVFDSCFRCLTVIEYSPFCKSVGVHNLFPTVMLRRWEWGLASSKAKHCTVDSVIVSLFVLLSRSTKLRIYIYIYTSDLTNKIPSH